MINDDDDITLEDISVNKDCDDGLESTIIFDFVDLSKPGPNDWFKLYSLDNKGLDGFITGLIAKKKDAAGMMQPYLIIGSDAFKRKCRQRIRPTQHVKITYGITTESRPFIWPVVIVDDLSDNKWQLTAWEIARAALTRWTQIISDKPNQRNIHKDHDNQDQVPKRDEFKTPPIDYMSAIKKAFKGRIIKDETHRLYADAGSVVKSKIDNPNFKKKVQKNGK